MPTKIVWAITGAGDFLPESVKVMQELVQKPGFEVVVVLSRAGLKVMNWYKLLQDVETLAAKVHVEEDANTPFIIAPLQRGVYRLMVVMPSTANTVAKIVHGIADTLITNSLAQAQKTDIPIYIYPVDQSPGSVTTILPSGEKLILSARPIDLENVKKLRAMKGFTVLNHPSELLQLLEKYRES